MLTTHGVDGISSLEHLSAKVLPRDRSGSISTLDTGVADIELENQVDIAVAIDIVKGRLDRYRLRARYTKTNRIDVDRGGAERRRRQHGNLNFLFVLKVDVVPGIPRDDIDRDR